MNSSTGTKVPVGPAFGDSFGPDHEKIFLLPIPTIVFWSRRSQNARECSSGHDSEYGCFNCEICGHGPGPCSANRGQFIIEIYVNGPNVYVLIRNSNIPICKEKRTAQTTARTYFMTNNSSSEDRYRQHYTIKSLGTYIESCAHMKFPWLSNTDYFSDQRVHVIYALEKIADGMSATEAFGSLFKEMIAKNVDSRIIPPTPQLCGYVTRHCEKHYGEDGYKKGDYALGCLKPTCHKCYPWTGAQPSYSESGPIDIPSFDPHFISWMKAKAPYEVPPPAPVASSNSSASAKPVAPSAPVASSNSSASSALAKPVTPSASMVVSNVVSNAISSSTLAPSRSSAVPVDVSEAITRLRKSSDRTGPMVSKDTFNYATNTSHILDLTSRNLSDLLDGKLALQGFDFTKITTFRGVDKKDILLVLNHFQNYQRVLYVG